MGQYGGGATRKSIYSHHVCHSLLQMNCIAKSHFFSGKSGAGKTENTKKVILAAIAAEYNLLAYL